MDSNALKNEFLVESFENLSTINEDITRYEKDSANKDILNKIYRTVHTMKGSASFLGYHKLQELTHSAENLLDALREDLVSLQSGIVDTLLLSFDACFSILKSIESNDDEGKTDITNLKNNLDNLLNGGDLESTQTIQVEENKTELVEEKSEQISEKDFSEENLVSNAALESLKELVDSGKVDESALSEAASGPIKVVEKVESELPVNAAALESLKELTDSGVIDTSVWDQMENQDTIEVKEKKDEVINEVKSPLLIKEDAQIIDLKNIVTPNSELLNNSKSIVDSVVRVNVNVIDKIMNLVGELVLNRNQVLQYSNANHEKHELTRLSQQLNNITSELQEQVMSTRMQPIGSILTKFERLVRDFSHSHSKKIDLELKGHETELDKTLIEAIRDPLVHIVRNAVDHGIESIEERLHAGKPERGTIGIKAYNESGQVTIEVTDDGHGLNVEKIKSKAIEKNIYTSEQLEKMSEQQIFGLIFNPGFSTAESITDISGRGVGMDVVKTNVEKIGGNITVTSEEGIGTSFKMRIPLTLAIVPALIVRNNGQSFAIPQVNLVELVRLEGSKELSKVEQISGSEFLRLRGNLTPLFRLEKSLELNKVEEKYNKLIKSVEDYSFKNEKSTELRVDDDSSLNIAILNAENNYFGIIIDEILDTEEIVVKPIESIKGLSIFSGATIMGDGRVSLILDAFGFLNKFTILKDFKKENDIILKKQIETIEHIGEMQENILFKLFDDRVYALPLSLVSRLEEFSFDRIEKIGDAPIIRYLDAPMPLVNLESSLGLNAHSSLDNPNKDKDSKLLCIVTTIIGKNYGLVVKEILDISIDNVEIDDSAVDREGILGTIYVQNKTVSMIDLYSILNDKGVDLTPIINKETISSNKTKRILLVDDSAMYRKMESDALTSFGYHVDTGINGEDGLVQLENNQYDLLITDIEMPVLDGFEFIKKVRSNNKFSSIPVVALSTRTSDIDREKGKQAGFDYHLEKFKKDEVLQLVSDILKRN